MDEYLRLYGNDISDFFSPQLSHFEKHWAKRCQDKRKGRRAVDAPIYEEGQTTLSSSRELPVSAFSPFYRPPPPPYRIPIPPINPPHPSHCSLGTSRVFIR